MVEISKGLLIAMAIGDGMFIASFIILIIFIVAMNQWKFLYFFNSEVDDNEWTIGEINEMYKMYEWFI